MALALKIMCDTNVAVLLKEELVIEKVRHIEIIGTYGSLPK
jgi:hypothetical protein